MAEGSNEFQHSARIEPESLKSLWLTLTTEPWVHVNIQKKAVYYQSCFAACNSFFACSALLSFSDSSGWISRPDTKFNSELAVLFLCHVLTRDQWMIERLSKQWVLLWWATTSRQFHRKFHFTWIKSDLSQPDICKALKPFWHLNWVSIARAVALFCQESRLLPAATAADLETPCVCACLP